MGLRLIYGRAGTGKSEKCYKEIWEKIMNSNLPAKQRNGIFYKILLKIKQIFRRKKYEEENLESNKVIVNSNNQFKNNIKIDIENIEFNNEYQKQQFMEQLKNNQELLEKFSNDRLKVILQYYLDENNKKRERLKKISN